MNTATLKTERKPELKMDFFSNVESGELLVNIEKICNYYGKPFKQICQDDDAVNDIIDHYLEMVGLMKIYDCKAPF